MVNSNGYMYNFGGNRYNNYGSSVSRIALNLVVVDRVNLTSDWEKLDDMATADEDMIVIPYNF